MATIEANKLVVEGLNFNRYLINNPIWIDLSNIGNTAKYVTLSISPYEPADREESLNSTIAQLRLYVNGSKLSFDLSESIKAFFDEPNHPTNVVDNQPIKTNYLKATINLQVISQSGKTLQTRSFIKDFIRGGEESNRANITHPAGLVLKESEKLPRWGTNPMRKYIVNANGTITSTAIMSRAEVEQMKEVGCNSLYFRFLNTLGGYSYWLFEQWEIDKKAKSAEVISRRENNVSLGHEIEHTLTVESRVERKYFKTMRALCQSPEVHVMSLTTNLFRDHTDVPFKFKGWERVYNAGNSIKTNSQEDVQSFSLKFDLLLKHNPLVKW